MAEVIDISVLRDKLGIEIGLVTLKAARWRAMGDKFPKARRSFHRSADAMLDEAAKAIYIQVHTQDPYLLAIALDDMRSYVNAD